MSLRKRLFTAAALFLLVAAVHGASRVSAQGDSRWVVPQALSLLHRHTFALDAYASRFPGQNYYFIECVTSDHRRFFPYYQPTCPAGHFYYLCPPALPLLAAPFVAVLDPAVALLGVKDPLWSTKIVEIFIASLLVAAATAILYLALQQILTWPEAVVLALIFAFATSAWSLVSRSLASHAPVVLLNSLLAYLLFRSFDRPRLIWLMVPVAVLSFYFRPTNVTSLAAIAVYVWVHARRQIPIAVLASLPIVAVFLAISLDIYGTVLTPYFYSTRSQHTLLSFHPKVFEALAGNLLSPGRGMLVYCPFLLLLFWPPAWRTDLGQRFRVLRPYFVAIVITEWLLVSLHDYWWAGFAYGPRYLCDILPYLLVLMAPVVRWASTSRMRSAAFACLVLVALFIHGRGAYSAAVHQWSAVPVSVDQQPDRVWDWRDPAFLRGL